MKEFTARSLDAIARDGARLRKEYLFDWPEAVHQCACCLRLTLRKPDLPPMVAIAGGASSGKSTIFNNLLEGHQASRITARGHATRGPILAVNERQQADISQLISNGSLMPGLDLVPVEIDSHTEGEPAKLAVLFHSIESLGDSLLFDTPDFTSQAAHHEGDVLLSLLPWFDRVIIVIDRERWFDRQTVSTLRAASSQYGQQRTVLFNRTEEGESLSSTELDSLKSQADRLATDGMMILEFRRGRGLCRFPPGTFADIEEFVAKPKVDRLPVLRRVVADAAEHVLNQNDERQARLIELRDALGRLLEGVIPTERDCMMAMMSPKEREQMSIVFRVFRVSDFKSWMSNQSRAVGDAIRKVPVLGMIMGGSSDENAGDGDTVDRRKAAVSYSEGLIKRCDSEVFRAARRSSFWKEVRQWTDAGPEQSPVALDDQTTREIEREADAFDRALTKWNERVDSELSGMGSNVKGAIGAGALGIAIVLVAVPGSVTLLTLASAKGAIGAALGKLAALTGAGALFGRHIGRFVDVIQEKLIGSAELTGVRNAAKTFRSLLVRYAEQIAEKQTTQASRLVLSEEDPLAESLACLAKDEEEAGQS